MTCFKERRSRPRDARSVATIMEILPLRYADSVLRDADDLLDLMIVPIMSPRVGSRIESSRESRDADSEDLVKIRTVLRAESVFDSSSSSSDELASDSDVSSSDDSDSELPELDVSDDPSELVSSEVESSSSGDISSDALVDKAAPGLI